MTEGERVIEQLQRIGSVTIVPNTIPAADLKRVADFVLDAKTAGHAITVEETIEPGKNGNRIVRVHHYLTCATCVREAQDG